LEGCKITTERRGIVYKITEKWNKAYESKINMHIVEITGRFCVAFKTNERDFIFSAILARCLRPIHINEN